MIAKLFFVALFSGALATKQVGDFLYRNALVQDKFTDEETLRKLTEEAAEKARQVSMRAYDVETEFTSNANNVYHILMRQITMYKRQWQKVVNDTVFKGMDKNQGTEVYECIAKGGGEGFKLLDQVKDIIPDTLHNVTEKHVNLVKHYKYVVKEFYEYVEAFYQTKSQELQKANADAIRKKIMKEVMDKMKLLQSILENINRNITDAKSVFFEHLGYVVYSLSAFWRIIYGKSWMITECVP